MRTLVFSTGLALLGLLAVPAVHAATPKQLAQQQKMKDCNKQADDQGLKGAGKGKDRQAFMKTCLSGAAAAATNTASAPAAAAAPTGRAAQQAKMKDCNKQAGDQKLAGAARKQFMSTCLSGSTAAPAH